MFDNPTILEHLYFIQQYKSKKKKQLYIDSVSGTE